MRDYYVQILSEAAAGGPAEGEAGETEGEPEGGGDGAADGARLHRGSVSPGGADEEGEGREGGERGGALQVSLFSPQYTQYRHGKGLALQSVYP